MAVVPVVVMVQGFIMVLPFIVVVLLAMLGAGMWRGFMLVRVCGVAGCHMPVRRLLCRCPRRCHGLRRHRHRRPPRYRRLGRLPRRRRCRHLARHRRRLVVVECGALSGRALWPLVNTVVCRDGSGVLVGPFWLLPESWCGG